MGVTREFSHVLTFTFQDVEQAVAMLCRALEVSSWKPVRAAKFLMDHPKKNEVLEVPFGKGKMKPKPRDLVLDPKFERWKMNLTFLLESRDIFNEHPFGYLQLQCVSVAPNEALLV